MNRSCNLKQREVYAEMAAHRIQDQIIEMHLAGESEEDIGQYFGADPKTPTLIDPIWGIIHNYILQYEALQPEAVVAAGELAVAEREEGQRVAAVERKKDGGGIDGEHANIGTPMQSPRQGLSMAHRPGQ